MASYAAEAGLVGRFVAAVKAEYDHEAWAAAEIVRPEMFEAPAFGHWWSVLVDRFAAGRTPLVDDDVLASQLDPAATSAWIAWSSTSADLVFYATKIRDHYLSREQVRLLRLGLQEAEKAVDTPDKPRRIADRLSLALMNLFAADYSDGRPQTVSDALDAELACMDAEEQGGVTLPWPKMQELCGPWMPGDAVGLSAYSNGGKSTLAANLAAGFARRGTPVICFPTEMRETWLSRLLASQSDVPQKIAERRQWKKATADQREAYADTIEWVRGWPLEIVNRPDISPAEIATATRVLRKRWTGRTVVVVIDHMHRLRYSEDANKEVGHATKMLRDFAGTDTEGGLILLMLYQPRKPERDVYGPIAGHMIRGDSSVWNELDIHISPFRHWVACSSDMQNEWGTAKTVVDPSGRPKFAKPEAEGAKLDDEHVYVKIDKQRVGGEGPVLTLNIKAPSGFTYELATIADTHTYEVA